MKTICFLFFSLISSSFLFGQVPAAPIRFEYYAGLPFWESPVQPFKGEYQLTKDEALRRIHMRFGYDDQNRIVEVSIHIGTQYKEFEGFFGNLYINAPITKITYEEGKETHRFYDRFENRIAVMNNVFEKVYLKDRYNRNQELTFLDKDGHPTVDMFGNASYTWTYQADGSIWETRLDKDGKITPLRGSFQFLLTRITYGTDGNVSMLQNIDDHGNLVNAECGASTLKYYYDSHGRFSRWEVYDQAGRPARGPSNTAGEQNIFLNYYLKDIVFFDESNLPATHWSGVEKWNFQYDSYGNILSVNFRDFNDKPKNGINGYAHMIYEWSTDGRYLLSQSYLDENGNLTEHPASGIAQITYTRVQGLLTEIQYFDKEKKPKQRKDNGAASINYKYDKKNMLVETTLKNAIGKEIIAK